MSLFSFPKKERLSSKIAIDRLFREGSTFFIHPFKVYWHISPYVSGSHAQVLIIIGKRVFKRAVDRNRIRRQIREIYRHHKVDLNQYLKEKNLQCHLAFIYAAPNYYEFSEIEKKIKLAIHRLKNDIGTKLNNINRSLSDN
jgi:ribonuclease P protein component